MKRDQALAATPGARRQTPTSQISEVRAKPRSYQHPSNATPMPDSFFAAQKTRKRKRSMTARDSGGPASKKPTRTAGAKGPAKGKGKEKARTRTRDEELESDGTQDEGVDDMDLRAEEVYPNESGEEDEEETPAEKRLRLAKLYLESVKGGLGTWSILVCVLIL